jgi:Bacterial type III secretion protein (HrpB4)
LPEPGRNFIWNKLVLRALHEFQTNVNSAFCWAHSSWISFVLDRSDFETNRLIDAIRPLFDGSMQGRENGTRHMETDGHRSHCSRLLVQACRVKRENLNEFGRVGVAILDCLPIHTSLRALRIRAVLERKDELRYLIDRRSRHVVEECIELSIDRLLSELNHTQLSIKLIKNKRSKNSVPLDFDKVTKEDLALVGYKLVLRDYGEQALHRLFCLALPYNEVRRMAVEVECGLVSSASDGENGTEWLLGNIGRLVPECAWLSG